MTDEAERGKKPILLLGLPGAGKTTVGRRLAQRLGLPFADADAEIEAAARGAAIHDFIMGLRVRCDSPRHDETVERILTLLREL